MNLCSSLQGDKMKKMNHEQSIVFDRLLTKINSTSKNIFNHNMFNVFEFLINIPISFEVKGEYSSEKKEEFTKHPIIHYIGGHIKIEDNFRFMVYLDYDETDIKFSDGLLLNRDFVYSFMFVYMHELFHIFMKHYSPSITGKYKILAKKFNNELNDEDIHHYLNSAFDYFINDKLIEKSSIFYTNIRQHASSGYFLYDPKYNNKTVEFILKDLIENKKISKQNDQYFISINDTLKDITDINKPIDGKGQVIDIDSLSEDIKEHLSNTVRDLSEKLTSSMKAKGNGSQELLSELGIPIEVSVNWLDKLESSLKQQISLFGEKKLNTYSRIKNKYRHIGVFPGEFYFDNQLSAIIAIDQSGSMSDIDLRKINYIVEKLYKKTKDLTIIIHDTDIVKEIKSNNIKEFIKTRVACGGTSHHPVWKYAKEYSDKHKKDKILLLSFSDFYSDEQEFDWNIPNIIPYFITNGDTPKVNTGKKLNIDTGEFL